MDDYDLLAIKEQYQVDLSVHLSSKPLIADSTRLCRSALLFCRLPPQTNQVKSWTSFVVKHLGSSRPTKCSRYLHLNSDFTRPIQETANASFRHSCRAPIKRLGISLP